MIKEPEIPGIIVKKPSMVPLNIKRIKKMRFIFGNSVMTFVDYTGMKFKAKIMIKPRRKKFF